MSRLRRPKGAWALILTLVALSGCSSPSIVGEWQGEIKGRVVVFTFFSDGTGDVTVKGMKTNPITWKRVADKWETTVGKETAVVTLRENGTLSIQDPKEAEMGILILKRKTD